MGDTCSVKRLRPLYLQADSLDNRPSNSRAPQDCLFFMQVNVAASDRKEIMDVSRKRGWVGEMGDTYSQEKRLCRFFCFMPFIAAPSFPLFRLLHDPA